MDLFTNKNCAGEIDHTILSPYLCSNFGANFGSFSKLVPRDAKIHNEMENGQNSPTSKIVRK